MNTLRRTFVEGLVTLTPIFLFVAAVWWIYSLLSSISVIMFIEPPLFRAGILLALFVILIFLLGSLMRTAIGELADRVIHDLINRFPIIRVIYNAVKFTLKTVLTGSGSTLPLAKLEVWDNYRMIAFDTGHRTADGRAILFIPGAPDVTSGFVVEVDPNNLIETDDTLLDALVRLLSCGFGNAKEQGR